MLQALCIDENTKRTKYIFTEIILKNQAENRCSQISPPIKIKISTGDIGIFYCISFSPGMRQLTR